MEENRPCAAKKKGRIWSISQALLHTSYLTLYHQSRHTRPTCQGLFQKNRQLFGYCRMWVYFCRDAQPGRVGTIRAADIQKLTDSQTAIISCQSRRLRLSPKTSGAPCRRFQSSGTNCLYRTTARHRIRAGEEPHSEVKTRGPEASSDSVPQTTRNGCSAWGFCCRDESC